MSKNKEIVVLFTIHQKNKYYNTLKKLTDKQTKKFEEIVSSLLTGLLDELFDDIIKIVKEGK
jgi:hypothetical protein